jgi:dihydroorotase-like cyclic amidohydrolase
LINETVIIFSSDHAPSICDHPQGKKKGLVNGIPHYLDVPNGLPGVETGRISAQRFAEVTSINLAKLMDWVIERVVFQLDSVPILTFGTLKVVWRSSD